MRDLSSLFTSSSRCIAWGLLCSLLISCGHLGVELNGDEDPLRAGSDAAVKDPPEPKEPSQGEEPGPEPKPEPKPPEPAPGDASVAPEPAKDSGSEEPHDSGMPPSKGDASTADQDAGSMAEDSGGVEPPPVDSGKGDPPIDPTKCDKDRQCSCKVEETCVLECLSPRCEAKCERGSKCDIAVGESEEVIVDCAEGATCQAKGPRADIVNFVCRGAGNCYAVCGEAEICNMECVGTGKCTLNCQAARTCNVACSDPSKCYLEHPPDSDALVNLSCELPVKECNRSLLACNALCPEPPQPTE